MSVAKSTLRERLNELQYLEKLQGLITSERRRTGYFSSYSGPSYAETDVEALERIIKERDDVCALLIDHGVVVANRLDKESLVDLVKEALADKKPSKRRTKK